MKETRQDGIQAMGRDEEGEVMTGSSDMLKRMRYMKGERDNSRPVSHTVCHCKSPVLFHSHLSGPRHTCKHIRPLISLSGDEAAWIMERMLYRSPDETCRPLPLQNGPSIAPERGSLCIGAGGHRRLVVNPQRVSLMTPHASVCPPGDGVHLQSSAAHINTYAVSGASGRMGGAWQVPQYCTQIRSVPQHRGLVLHLVEGMPDKTQLHPHCC